MSKHTFFQPEMNNERLKRQQGYFLIFPNISDIGTIENKMNEYSDVNLKEFIIAKEDKEQIKHNLEDFGIRNDYLFPELEHSCSDLVVSIKKLLNDKSNRKYEGEVK